MAIRPELEVRLRWVLRWYATRPGLRALVRHLPFGSGAALDVALIAVQHALLAKTGLKD